VGGHTSGGEISYEPSHLRDRFPYLAPINRVMDRTGCPEMMKVNCHRLSAEEEADMRRGRVISEHTRCGRAEIVSGHPAMLQLIQKGRRIAQNPNVTVLIRGETGTGKNLFARFIHFSGATNEGPFVEANCSGVTYTSLAAELFGCERGDHGSLWVGNKGAFELADGGTLYLNDIGNMSVRLQARLLRVIEKKRIRRLGSVDEMDVSVRVIASTTVDLEKALEDGIFREDFYYRLNAIPVELPPLRERGEDIIFLAERFAQLYAQQYNRHINGFSRSAEKMLMEYAWPGNVRELRSTIERVIFMGNGDVIEAEQLELM